MWPNPHSGFGHIYWSRVKNFAEEVSFSKRSNANFIIITKQNSSIFVVPKRDLFTRHNLFLNQTVTIGLK